LLEMAKQGSPGSSPSKRLVRINHWWLDAEGCVHSGRNQTSPIEQIQGPLITTQGSSRTYYLLEPHPRIVASLPHIDRNNPLADRTAVVRAWLAAAPPAAAPAPTASATAAGGGGGGGGGSGGAAAGGRAAARLFRLRSSNVSKYVRGSVYHSAAAGQKGAAPSTVFAIDASHSVLVVRGAGGLSPQQVADFEVRCYRVPATADADAFEFGTVVLLPAVAQAARAGPGGAVEVEALIVCVDTELRLVFYQPVDCAGIASQFVPAPLSVAAATRSAAPSSPSPPPAAAAAQAAASSSSPPPPPSSQQLPPAAGATAAAAAAAAADSAAAAAATAAAKTAAAAGGGTASASSSPRYPASAQTSAQSPGGRRPLAQPPQRPAAGQPQRPAGQPRAHVHGRAIIVGHDDDGDDDGGAFGHDAGGGDGGGGGGGGGGDGGWGAGEGGFRDHGGGGELLPQRCSSPDAPAGPLPTRRLRVGSHETFSGYAVKKLSTSAIVALKEGAGSPRRHQHRNDGGTGGPGGGLGAAGGGGGGGGGREGDAQYPAALEEEAHAIAERIALEVLSASYVAPAFGQPPHIAVGADGVNGGGDGGGLMCAAPFALASVAECCVLFERAAELLALDAVCTKVAAPAKVFGDIHGQLYDLLGFFHRFGAPTHRTGDINLVKYVFLGDYVDRGPWGLEVVALLLSLKVMYPSQVTLLRGNHEDREVNTYMGFLEECRRRILADDDDDGGGVGGVGGGVGGVGGVAAAGERVFGSFHACCDMMPLAALIEGRVLCVHGGIGESLSTIGDIEAIARPLREPQLHALALDLLWSDPSDNDGVMGCHANNRGGNTTTFGPDRVAGFCERNDLDLIVRAHECVMSGFEFFAGGKLVTVFSATNYCGQYENDGAMLEISRELEVFVKVMRAEQYTANHQQQQQEQPPHVLAADSAVMYSRHEEGGGSGHDLLPAPVVAPPAGSQAGRHWSNARAATPPRGRGRRADQRRD
jgi:diadenosine tetraphosphatase ApaH/serine/threonine PP2A family protein phosphatase